MKLSKLIYAIPVIGWMLESAVKGHVSEKVFFLVNLVMIWAFAVAFFGLPALIFPAVVFAVGFLIFLVFFTASDIFDPAYKDLSEDA